MKAKSTTTEEQLNNIMECRQSGLTVYQWCEEKGIAPSSYYNWISRLRKKGITIPEFKEKTQNPIPPVSNEVVQLNIVHELNDISYIEHQNTRISKELSPLRQPTVEIIIEDTTVHFFNDTDPIIIESIIKNVGGIYRGR
jgi:transposase-like protein